MKKILNLAQAGENKVRPRYDLTGKKDEIQIWSSLNLIKENLIDSCMCVEGRGRLSRPFRLQCNEIKSRNM